MELGLLIWVRIHKSMNRLVAYLSGDYMFALARDLKTGVETETAGCENDYMAG